MAGDPNAIEQAVSRTLRDNLERIQRTSDELHRAVSDLVSACASSRPSNSLPPMVRAQASAASLSAVLDVLSRFVTAALQPAMRSPAEQEMLRAIAISPEIAAPEISAPGDRPLESVTEAPATAPESRFETQAEHVAIEAPPEVTPVVASDTRGAVLEHPSSPVVETAPSSHLEPSRFEEVSSNFEEAPAIQHSAPVEEIAQPYDSGPEYVQESVGDVAPEPAGEPAESALPVQEIPAGFNVAALPTEQQELHRRAYRVAKVSMQDIKMLRPEDVRLGRENKDLCSRLRDDIEKAHKEYDRRFQPILSHPVDYFYDWMVEILGGGNPEALGEYPYPSAVMRH